jgi:hypothetical protein
MDLTSAYGATLPVTLSAPDDTAVQQVNVQVAGLLPNTTYHFRLLSHQCHGTSHTADVTIGTLDYAYNKSHFAGTTGGGGISTALEQGRALSIREPSPEHRMGISMWSTAWAHTIRKVTADGVVTTFAGQAGMAGSTDGTGSAARFDNPPNWLLIVTAIFMSRIKTTIRFGKSPLQVW